MFYSWVFLCFFSWQMSPLMRRFPNPKLRNWRTLTLCAVGFKWGVSCSTGGGGRGASVRGESILFSLSFSSHVTFYFFTFLPLYLYFFHLPGDGYTEKGWFPMGGGPQIGDGATVLEGWGIGEDGSISGRFRGGGFLWASVGSNVIFLCIPSPLLIRKSATPHPAPSPICPLRSPEDLMSLILQTRQWRLSLQLFL